MKNKHVLKIRDPKKLENWDWPYLRVNFGGTKEYACPCGVGHGGIHGCCGCCAHESYKKKVLNEHSEEDC